VQNLWKTLNDECDSMSLKNNVNPKLFEKTIFEFELKIQMTKELKSCLFWYKSHGKRSIRSTAIRKWFLDSVQYAKEAELRRQTATSDRAATAGVKTSDLPHMLSEVGAKMGWK